MHAARHVFSVLFPTVRSMVDTLKFDDIPYSTLYTLDSTLYPDGAIFSILALSYLRLGIKRYPWLSIIHSGLYAVSW